MPKNRVRVSIMETEYVVLSDENEAYVVEMAAEIEKKIAAIVNMNPKISMLMATTLAAMDYCDIAKKSTLASDNLRSQIKDYLDESSKSRNRVEDNKKELVKLKQEIQSLKARLAEAQKFQKSNKLSSEEENPSNRQVTSPSPISRPVKGKVTPTPVGGSAKAIQMGKADDEIMDFFDQRYKK